MRLLGIPETHTRSGYLVVKPYVKNVLECLGSDVFDSVGRKIGVIIDVIGRVDDPRVVVRLDKRELSELLVTKQERLYFVKKTKRR